MHLDANFPVLGDVWVGLGVVEAFDAIDPGLNARSFAADAVFDPVFGFDGGDDVFLFGRGGDDLVASGFVVEFAPPTGSGVDLVTAHFGVVRDANASDLDSAVDEPASPADADFEFEVEVVVRAFGCEEIVMFDVFGQAAAGDESVFHAPELGYAFPLGEGLSVEQRRGCCGGGCADGGERERGECEAERMKVHGFAGR